MNRFVLLLLASLSAAPALAATPALTIEREVLTTRVDGELTIDPTGAVQSYRVLTEVSPGFAAKVEGMVRRLRFEPEKVDGRPVRASNRMRVTLAGTPSENDGLDVRLDNIGFPEAKEDRPENERAPGLRMKVDRKVPPQYPLSAMRLGVDADVLVMVKVGRDGRIVDAAVRQSALIAAGGEPKAVAALLAAFEHESVRMVKRWHVAVNIDDGVQPTDEQMTALVPVIFRMGGRTPPRFGVWVWETRSQKREAPWLTPDPTRPSVGVADVADPGEMLRPDEGFRLATALPQLL